MCVCVCVCVCVYECVQRKNVSRQLTFVLQALSMRRTSDSAALSQAFASGED